MAVPLKSDIEALCASKGMRMTDQRRVIARGAGSGGGGGSPGQFQYTLPVGQSSENYGLTATTGPAPGDPANRVLVAGSQADDGAAAITLPAGWTSTVYDTVVTSLSASTNGVIQVNGTAPTTFTNMALPHTVAPAGPRLFPYWDDLNSATTRSTPTMRRSSPV